MTMAETKRTIIPAAPGWSVAKVSYDLSCLDYTPIVAWVIVEDPEMSVDVLPITVDRYLNLECQEYFPDCCVLNAPDGLYGSGGGYYRDDGFWSTAQEALEHIKKMLNMFPPDAFPPQLPPKRHISAYFRLT
jgi:hypothetical protein